MPTRRFEQAQLLVGGWAVVFCLIEFAQAQPGYVPPPTPLPPPVLNPSNPGTVPQPSYRSITPSTRSTVPLSEVTPPANEEPSTRAVRHHHHRGRYIVIGPSLGSYSCGYLGCVRLYPWAFGRTRAGGFSGWSKSKDDFDKVVKLKESWTVHDLRRTVRTGLGELGIQPHIAEAVLNHIPAQTDPHLRP